MAIPEERFTDAIFRRFADMIYQRFGIVYKEEKREMLRAKISRHMRREGMDSYEEFFNLLLHRDSRDLWMAFVDDITIHTTNFFRERNHFDYIRRHIDDIFEANPRILGRRELRAWSSAASTGEEPYTLAMVLAEALGDRASFKILATDVSRGALAQGMAGEYRVDIRQDVEPLYLQKYFVRTSRGFMVTPELRHRVVFRLFNLADPFPFRHPLDVIFCRNVMIYFSAEMQQELVDKVYRALAPGGLFFIGHSESLIGKRHRFKYIQPTVYMR